MGWIAELQMGMVIVTEVLMPLCVVIFFPLFFYIHVSEQAFNGFPWAVGSNVFCVKPLYPVGYGESPW